jgi:hypothetical protein
MGPAQTQILVNTYHHFRPRPPKIKNGHASECCASDIGHRMHCPFNFNYNTWKELGKLFTCEKSLKNGCLADISLGGIEQTLGKLDEFLEDNALAGCELLYFSCNY